MFNFLLRCSETIPTIERMVCYSSEEGQMDQGRSKGRITLKIKVKAKEKKSKPGNENTQWLVTGRNLTSAKNRLSGPCWSG